MVILIMIVIHVLTAFNKNSAYQGILVDTSCCHILYTDTWMIGCKHKLFNFSVHKNKNILKWKETG